MVPDELFARFRHEVRTRIGELRPVPVRASMDEPPKLSPVFKSVEVSRLGDVFRVKAHLCNERVLCAAVTRARAEAGCVKAAHDAVATILANGG